jgi:hypothetical protein
MRRNPKGIYLRDDKSNMITPFFSLVVWLIQLLMTNYYDYSFAVRNLAVLQESRNGDVDITFVMDDIGN